MKESFSIVNKGNELIIINDSYKDFRSIIFFGFGSLLIFSPLIFYRQILNIEITPLFISILHFAFGTLFLRRFLWKLNGKEILSITDSTFYFQRKGSFLITKKTYPVSEFIDVIKVPNGIKTLQLVSKIRESNQRLIYLNGKGKIWFKFKTGTEIWFNNVTEAEINLVLIEIQKKIKN